MKQKTLDFLEAHKSEQPSTFTEDAKWRQENEVWLKWSRGVALSIVDYMQANSLSRSDIANKLGVTLSMSVAFSLAIPISHSRVWLK